MSVPTRRERLRTATVAEIKQGARRLLVAGGPQAISLRAIARDMGMTASAIYRYFPSLDALISSLAGDLFDELRTTVEAAREEARDDAGDEANDHAREEARDDVGDEAHDEAGGNPLGQLAAMGRTFRRWSIQHPVEFALMFGTPVPGMVGFVEQCVDENHPGARFCAAFMRPFLEIWHRAPFRTPPRELIEQQLGPHLEPLRRSQGDVPIEVAYLFLSGWTRLYGLVSMEVFNHLRWAVTEPEALFEIELADFIQQLVPGQAVPATGRPATTAD